MTLFLGELCVRGVLLSVNTQMPTMSPSDQTSGVITCPSYLHQLLRGHLGTDMISYLHEPLFKLQILQMWCAQLLPYLYLYF